MDKDKLPGTERRSVDVIMGAHRGILGAEQCIGR
jgi:hypothetical protein